MIVKNHEENRCPICKEKLSITVLSCKNCRADFKCDKQLSPYDYLSPAEREYLDVFLSCRGNLSLVQQKLGISYPTAKNNLESLLITLGLAKKEKKPAINLKNFLFTPDKNNTKASAIIKNKLYETGGRAKVRSQNGKEYEIYMDSDGRSFHCEALPVNVPYTYEIFDVIVDLLKNNGGKAPKGNGRNFRLGYGQCTEDTVVGAIGKNYFGKPKGSYVYDPVFVLAAVLEWADIAHNQRGYLQLTADYMTRLYGRK